MEKPLLLGRLKQEVPSFTILQHLFLKITFSESRSSSSTGACCAMRSCVRNVHRHTVSTPGAASLPDAPMGEVAGVMLWTLRPRLWEGPGAGAVPGGPGGVSRCGDVRGVVGWDEEPPASRARRLRRICRGENPEWTPLLARPARLHSSGAAPRPSLTAGTGSCKGKDWSLTWSLLSGAGLAALPLFCVTALRYPACSNFKYVFAALENHLPWECCVCPLRGCVRPV